MSVSLIMDMVREGRISAYDGARLLELRRHIADRQRYAFWYGVRDGFTLGPLRRAIGRLWRRLRGRP